MILDLLWQQVAIGILGGISCELLHWYSLSRKPRGAKRFSNRTVYWASTAGMIILGGVMPFLYVSGSASALLCFHLGAATPILLQKLVAAAPGLTAPQGAAQTEPTLQEFFSW